MAKPSPFSNPLRAKESGKYSDPLLYSTYGMKMRMPRNDAVTATMNRMQPQGLLAPDDYRRISRFARLMRNYFGER